MTVTTASLTQPYQGGNNNAAIKAWGSGINSLIAGAGMVQTSDTGQVNWTTTTFNPTTFQNNFSAALIGYEVWKFNDSLQATKPVIFRVDYKLICYNQASYNCIASFTVGTISNGAGALTGANYSPYMITTNYYNSSNSVYAGGSQCFSSGDASYMNLVLGWDLPSYGANINGGTGLFFIDRTRDSSGTATGDGFVWGNTGAGGYWTNDTNTAHAIPAQTAAGTYAVYTYSTSSAYGLGFASTPVADNSGIVLPAYVPGSLSSGTTIAFQAPSVMLINGKRLPPILAALAYNKTDIALGSTVTVPVSGSNHTYFCLAGFAPLADRKVGSTTASLALRYE